MKRITIISTILFFGAKICCAQPGELDSSFGKHGIVKTSLGINYNYDYISNGKQVLLSGENIFILVEASGQSYLTKRLPDGSADITYGNNGFSSPIDISPSRAAIQTDGKIVVVGEAFNGIDYDFAIVRYNTNGDPDNSFSDDGIQFTDFNNDFDNAKDVAIQSDGKIVVAGETITGGAYDFAIARYNEDGSLDNTFSEDGKQTMDFGSDYDNATSLAIQNDKKIVLAGYTFNGTNHDFAICRYNANGTPDSTFSEDGKLTTDLNSSEDFINSIAIQNNGKIVTAGYVYTCDDVSCSNAEFALARYNSDGTFDSTFNGDGKQKTTFTGFTVANSLTIQNDGKIVVAGTVTPEGNSDFAIARYNTDGSADSTFDYDGKQATNFKDFFNASSVVVQSDGKILAAGAGNSGVNFTLVRYNNSGGLDSTFDEDGILIDQLRFNQGSTYYTSTAIQGDGKIVAAGITWNGSNYDFAVSRYNKDGTLDSSFSNGGKQNTDFGTGSSDDNATSIAIQSDGKILLAGNSYDNETGNGDFALARYNSNGALDSSFSEDGKQTTDFDGGNDYANSIALQSDGKIVVAGDNNYQFAIARYNPDGSLDKSFSNDGKQTSNFFPLDSYSSENASSLALQDDGKIVMAGNISFARPSKDESYFAFVRYKPDGSLDTFSMFDLGATYDNAKSIAMQKDGKIVLAGYSYKRIDEHTFSNPAFALIRLNRDGKPDTAFSADGMQTTYFDGDAEANTVAIQPDGKIVLAGSIAKANSTNTHFALARYNTDGSPDSSFSGDGKQTTDAGSGPESITDIAIENDKIYAVGSGQYPGNLGVVAIYQSGKKQTYSCPDSKIVSTDKGKCEATVTDVDPIGQEGNAQVNYTLSGATTGSGTGSVSGKIFNKGVTTVTYSLANDTASNCSFTITVNDKEAPRISPIFAFPNTLWPANNTMRKVYLFYHSKDNCGITDCKISVTGNQDIEGDWQIINDHLIKLRAEHSGDKARVYTITVTCTDAAGNAASRSATIKVSNFSGEEMYVNSESEASRPFENITNGFSLKAFPNPSKNYFNLQIQSNNNKEKINLRIYDVSGRLVETATNIIAGKNIQMGAALKQGTYIAEIEQGTYVQRLKLLKTK